MRKTSQPFWPGHPELNHEITYFIVEASVSLQEYEGVDDSSDGNGSQDKEGTGEGNEYSVQEDHKSHHPGREEDVESGATLYFHRNLS